MTFNLSEFKRLAGERTSAPWKYSMKTGFPMVNVPCHKSPSGCDAFEVDTCDGKACATAEFIAYAGTHADAIIDRIEKLEKVAECMRHAVAIGYFNDGGSTEGWAKEALKTLEERGE